MQSGTLDNRFQQFPGGQQPAAGGFPGLQSLQGGGFNPMQNRPGGMAPMPGAPGTQPGNIGGQRLPTGALPSGMQQLGLGGARVGMPTQQQQQQQFPGSVPGLNGLPQVRTGVNPYANLGAIGGASGMNANIAAQLQQQQQQQQQQLRPGGQPGVALGGLGGRLGNFGAGMGAAGGGYGAPSGDLLSMLSKAGGQRQDDGPAFNAADFPTLGGAGGQGQQHGSASGETFAALLNSQPNPVTGLAPGPAFGEEDFPALPGADGPGGGPRQDGLEGAAQLQQLQQQLGALGDQQQQALRMQQMMGKSVNPMQQQQPGAMQDMNKPERYGLLGLLSVIRMTDADLTTLALGTDLTTLGLNLSATEPLWKSFASPWADNPSAGDPDFKVPGCYLMPPPQLVPGHFSRFQPDTLFYVFYGMPGDEAQLAAAEELSNRGWYYHKELKAWLTRAPDTESVQKTDRFERGSFLVFDPSNWHVVKKDDFVVEFDKLERPIQLPKQQGQPAPQPTAT